MNISNLQALQELMNIPNWVAFKLIPDTDREGHFKKLPFDPRTGRLAKANDPTTWATYDEAYSYAERNGLIQNHTGGIGFEFSDGYAGIDLDNVVLPDGSLKDYAIDVVQTMDSYTEYSPSGKGLHILFKLTGNKKIGTKNNKLDIEFYNHSRYFTVTGNVYGEAKPVRERTEEARKVYAKYFIKQEKKNANTSPQNSPKDIQMRLTGKELLEKIFEHDNTGNARALWNGDISAYGGDHSAADLALCNILAWWTNGDATQMDNLFRDSGLMREKWDEKHGQQTYGDMTISKAIDFMKGNGYTGENPNASMRKSVPSESSSPVNTKSLHHEVSKPKYELPVTGYDYVTGGGLNTDLENFRKFPPIYTGFDNLDEKQGKLAPGLYALGAIPSLGKTSFSLQMADNMARAGNFVLYFALEQNRLELTTKSLSRLTAQENLNTAISSMRIRRGDYYNDTERKAFERAVVEYQKFARNIAIVELGMEATISTITYEIKSFIESTGLRPVVFVDYLQIIRPDVKPGKYQNTNTKDYVDDHVRILKKLQSDNNLIMVLVCSFNRANYSSPVDYESFKETGSIEYTADVLWGMQLQVVKNKEQDFLTSNEKGKGLIKRKAIKDASKAIPRMVMIENLKNRYGKKNYSCGYIYDCRFDYFVPDPNFKDEDKDNDTRTIY